MKKFVLELDGSLWTRDHTRAETLIRELRSGLPFVNGIVKSDARMPFGGMKKSGIGRELSCYGLLEFTNIKSIIVN